MEFKSEGRFLGMARSPRQQHGNWQRILQNWEQVLPRD